MNLAWEAALCADKSGFDREDISYVPSLNGSPYVEVVLDKLNATKLTRPEVEINPLYRFSNLFADMFNINLNEYQTSRELFFDIYLHYMVQLDLRQGLSRKQYQLRYILKDLLADVCEIRSDEVILQMEPGQIAVLLRLVWKLYRCGSSILLFKEVMKAIYPDSIIYESREKANQLLIYIGEKETERNKRQMDLLRAVFLPITKQVSLFWEHHFGIIGVSETMVLDEMVLF